MDRPSAERMKGLEQPARIMPGLGALEARERWTRLGLVLTLVMFCLALSLLSPRFLTPGNLINVVRQASINGIIAVGMTLVILTGGIDLSVGSILAFTGVVAASLVTSGQPPALAMASALILGSLMGMLNGAAVAYLRIPPFIATLGMMTVARGLALSYTQGRPITGFPESFRWLGAGWMGPLPVPVLVMALVFGFGGFLLSYTIFGEHLLAIGNNPAAAQAVGIPLRRRLVLTYGLSGFLASLAGLILIGRLDSAPPTLGIGYEFDAIAAVVIGGTRLTGGEGWLGGTLIGALIIGVLNNGINLLNIPSFYEQVFKGGVIAAALLLHRVLRRE
ncbi:Ribose import permease protein RbsC [Candidatus Thermoflexus japonica]|uniref:Ribose import permease protein RbsC n=1 Tax=Candidatus Thermoflexus japonica TaxID=2035417 RepID=A0A2H5Y7I4_9CHLR|nr:Ribose import permease protein RbsC [Candidatus Thermoflexus japonica]